MKLKELDLFRVSENHPEYSRHKGKIYMVAKSPFNDTWPYQNEYGELFSEDEVTKI